MAAKGTKLSEETRRLRSDIDTIREAMHNPERSHHDRCATKDGQPCDCYATYSQDSHDALDRLSASLAEKDAQIERLTTDMRRIEDCLDPRKGAVMSANARGIALAALGGDRR